jgi:hypothetical protein
MRHLYLFALLFSFTTQAQLSVGDSISTALLLDYLQGDNVIIENVQWQCDSAAIATFDYSGPHLQSNEGLLMSSGAAVDAIGPNDNTPPSTFVMGGGDADLELATGSSTFSTCILEFDITPDFGILLFDYVFGSEEYPEFVGSFNDGFLFLVSGPGIEGPYSSPFPEGSQNFCIIPGTDLPVTINNLNNGNDGLSGPCTNCQYYIHNGLGNEAPFDSLDTYIAYDGLTQQLLGNVEVSPGETYHVKIVIGDAADSAFDSGVFIQKQGFRSAQSLGIEEGLGMELNIYPNPTEDILTIEGLDAGQYTMTLVDGLGRRLLSQASRVDGLLRVDMAAVATGSYLLLLQDEKGRSAYHKVVKH